MSLCDPMDSSTLGFPVLHHLPKLMFIELMMSSNYFILCYPLPLLPSIFSSIRVFSSEWALWIRWPKFWSLSFSISPSNEYSGLSSFRIDWFDLTVQGTLKSLLQHHNSKASIRWCSAFFIVQLSCIYMVYHKKRGAFHVLFSLKSHWNLYLLQWWCLLLQSGKAPG